MATPTCLKQNGLDVKMKTKIKIGLALILLSVSFGTVSAQSVKSLELKYRLLQLESENQKNALDSLIKIYEIRINRLNELKSSGQKEKSEYDKLLQDAVALSKKIETLEKNVTKSESILETQKHVLDKKYSFAIDSLKLLEAAETDLKKKDVLSLEILTLFEKRILVRPQVYSLSYHPEKLIKINLAAITDSSERKIYADYIKSAISEVDKKLASIGDVSLKLNEIIRLQQKVEDFIEESDYDLNYGLYVNSPNYANLESGVKVNDFTSNRAVIEPQLHSYSVLLNQLSFQGQVNLSSEAGIKIDFQPDNFSLNDYYNLLDEVQLRLKAYKLLLAKKLTPKK